MRYLLIALCLLLCSCAAETSTPQSTDSIPAPTQASAPQPSTPQAVPQKLATTLLMNGSMSIGTADGQFTYDADAEPVKVNVGGAINKVYTPTSWSFTVISSFALLPSMVFTNDTAGHTAEWCIGTCLFGGPPVAMLTMKDGHGLQLFFAFLLNGDSAGNPPTFEQLGAKLDAEYGSDSRTGYVVIMQNATVSEPPQTVASCGCSN